MATDKMENVTQINRQSSQRQSARKKAQVGALGPPEYTTSNHHNHIYTRYYARRLMQTDTKISIFF